MVNLFDFIKSNCFKKGDFKLSSGIESKYYFDLKNAIFHPMVLDQIITNFGKIIEKNKLKFSSIGGMETGAIPLITEISMSNFLPSFYFSKQQKDYGSNKKYEGYCIQPVLLVDDVITTGKSIKTIIEEMEKIFNQKPSIAGILCIIDRQQHSLSNVYSIYKEKDFIS